MPQTLPHRWLVQFRKMTNVAQPSTIGRLAASQTTWTAAWHRPESTEAPLPSDALEVLVLREHQANFALWHEEDKARDPSATDAEIASVKRAIDALNQQRNDLVEEIDEWFLQHVVSPAPGQARALHSETPGMMLDRLSILALKVFHTKQEAEREDASSSHRAKNLHRLTILQEQRNDLTDALEALLSAILAGEKSFKLYRQMKMYNDPQLNPQVYRKLRG